MRRASTRGLSRRCWHCRRALPNSSTHLSLQGWTKKSERIKCLAPLPENPVTPQLEEMLVPAPYQPPEKKAKKKSKGPKHGLQCKGPPEAASEETEDVSSHEEDDDE